MVWSCMDMHTTYDRTSLSFRSSGILSLLKTALDKNDIIEDESHNEMYNYQCHFLLFITLVYS